MKSTTFIVTSLIALTLLVTACAPAATPTAAPTQPPATQVPAATQASVTQAPAATATSGESNGYSSSSSASATDTPAASSASGPATINVAQNSTYGSILTDGKGMTVYIYLNDTSTTPTCSGACANNWPAVLTNGNPVAGTGVDATKLGTTTLSNGTMQVTYNGHPLYYFVQDKASGDTKGQGIKSVWYVVSPAGDPIKQ